ncbi:MAG TPA: GtrA family protein [Pilimelia sp.]|nr:GtrA family protein [Pilimelia sp.]
MRLVRLLPHRLQTLAPEALAFGAIGLGNALLYFVIFNVTMGIGAVKATVIATVITTTLSYLANRHWTYRHRPKTALRREYTLFFAFNLAGMIIQAGIVGAAKYGLKLSEDTDRIELNLATVLGMGLATAFRFWSYRTMVFAPAAQQAVQPAVEPVAAPPQPRAGDPLAGINDPLDVELEAELAAADLDRAAHRQAP